MFLHICFFPCLLAYRHLKKKVPVQVQGGPLNRGKIVPWPPPPLWQPKVVWSDWQLFQHWLFYGVVVGGGVAAE
jgi:hypothetical protein